MPRPMRYFNELSLMTLLIRHLFSNEMSSITNMSKKIKCQFSFIFFSENLIISKSMKYSVLRKYISLKQLDVRQL